MHAATVEQVVIPASSLEDSPAPVHQLIVSPELSIVNVNILGTGSSLFAINNSYTVHTTATVPPGSYALTIVIQVAGASELSYAFLALDVTPNGKKNLSISSV